MDGVPAGRPEIHELGDEELVELVRSGDLDAFALLYGRHIQAVLSFARRCCRRHAEDLCAEAFTAMLRAIKSGRGPRGPLQPYLWTAVRHAAATWSRQDVTVLLVGEFIDLPDAASEADPLLSGIDRTMAVEAFNSLPERWRSILKHTVIDTRSARSAAAVFQIDSSAASSLAYRAREGLRQAYLQAHISRVTSRACQPFAEQLAAFTRGRLGARRTAAEQAHLAVCAECSRLLETLREIDRCFARKTKHTR